MWHKADDLDLQKYIHELHSNLSNISIDDEILTCHDVHCDNPYHKELSDDYCLDILDSITKSVGDKFLNSPYASKIAFFCRICRYFLVFCHKLAQYF